LATLVDASVHDALVMRLSAGWRPFPSAGFEVWLGYTSAWLSGSVAPADLAGFVAEPLGSEIAAALGSDVELRSQLHNIHVALGWRFVAWEHLVLRLTLGYTQTLGARSTLSVPDNPTIEAQAAPAVESTLDDAFKRFVKLPVLGLSAGYRF
ncbi:MAG: hypothetical protein IT373_13475, partial [Polyangiaceae bacterium]|nr:hypothetical protein [Polyangiaceae bacterium]